METVYLAGGCLWGVQAFVKTLPGVVQTEGGRANGITDTLDGEYDGYVEVIKTGFDPEKVSVSDLMGYLFEIIDPYSVNQQGQDIGLKYRTGLYSEDAKHLKEAQAYIDTIEDHHLIATEVLPLTNYVRSAEENQDRLSRFPNDYCHLPKELVNKYK
ncbi:MULTISPECIES: peptide-methionine (S)-S-oxide reductase [Staphylococcus]|jgi:peptide-methionine (S)-S-oxide reductase|uniref:Peptide methionine sulfoxide reductase MsrA n=1 Tax=Staphylococcus nepalensis TaxID=214473 RepID=A0A291JHG3_9STAP|nr:MULTISPECIES: peptide-methionine (S)-S-oxide reductase [Staphylococcus]VDG65884.1 methionine-S-sulfoxide reductase [Lacrimispora indolis]ATH59020.1 methionine sulfoxide reductase A [Staphylococcus nepalensis]ATH64111.1 methionine sulfoxide reductase A [Staphylococcus nepalensis]AWI43473.1 methionine sulfoxide reductase A [Staphylococcus nepalensis]MBO1206323.1 peptide-methionine (S)-S-oxide reductase [Staphylococcus nepalensis]